jgi:hypothetical protein
MALENDAYLVIEDDDGDTAVFHFESFQPTSTLDKNFLVGGNRGELIGEVVDFVPQIDSENSTGYVIDVGLGEKRFEYLVRLTPADSGPWGLVDNNDNPVTGGSAGANKLSAHDGPPLARAEVLAEWVRETLVDSVSQSGTARLYKGNFSTGRFAADGLPGLFNEPIPVAPSAVEIRRDPDEPSRVELTIEMIRFEQFGTGGGVLP